MKTILILALLVTLVATRHLSSEEASAALENSGNVHSDEEADPDSIAVMVMRHSEEDDGNGGKKPVMVVSSFDPDADEDEMITTERLPIDVEKELGDDKDAFEEFNKKFEKKIKKKYLKKYAKTFKKHLERLRKWEEVSKDRQYDVAINPDMVEIDPDDFDNTVLLDESDPVERNNQETKHVIDYKEAKKLREAEKADAGAEGADLSWNDKVVFDDAKGVSDPGAPTVSSKGFDWRQHGVITEVKNQRACSSCWTFTAAGVLEAQHARKNNELIDLSEMQMSCVYNRTICQAGATEAVFEYFLTRGIGEEKEAEYNIKGDMTCKQLTPKVQVAKHISLVGSTVQEIKDALVVDGPIAAGLYVSGALPYYKKGIYDQPCTDADKKRGHAVVIIGFDSANGTDYWIIKNSWGTGWGENGFGKFKMGSNLCGIESKRLNQAQII